MDTKALNTRISLHKSNIKLPENRKLYVSKHHYKCRCGVFRTMTIYQTGDYTLLQIKEKYIEKIQPHIKQNVTWYATERGKGRSIPLKRQENEGQSSSNSMTRSLLDKERNPGHSSIITGWNSGRRKKSNDWPIDQTPSFTLAENWKRKFSSGQTLARDRCQFSQAPGKSPVKRVEQNLWTEVSRKGKHSARLWGCHSPGKVEIPKYWNYMYSKKKERN